MTTPLSLDETLAFAHRFIECAIHLILYIRKVYPQNLFRDTQLFDIRLHECRHPRLTDYIRKIVDSAMDQLKVGALERVIIVIKRDDLSEEPLERFVLDFTWLIDHAHIVGGGNWRPKDPQDGLTRQDVTDTCRATLQKLKTAADKLGPTEEDCTWAAIIQLIDEVAEVPGGRDADKWGPAEQRHAGGDDEQGTEVSPLRRIQFGCMNIELSVEQLS